MAALSSEEFDRLQQDRSRRMPQPTPQTTPMHKESGVTEELLFLKIKTEELREAGPKLGRKNGMSFCGLAGSKENARALRHFQAQSAQTGVDALRKAGAGVWNLHLHSCSMQVTLTAILSSSWH